MSVSPSSDRASAEQPDPSASRARRVGHARVFLALVVVLLLGTLATAGLGYQLFYRDHSDSLRKVDAIVVLGGEHDGREDYGLTLAREGYANTVVVSNPYINNEYTRAGTVLMNRICSSSTDKIEVICFRPDPSTTRGEAMFVQRLAEQRHWKSVIAVSWRYHLVRARYIFGQCFSGEVVMHSVPRDYGTSVAGWTAIFAYQYSGLAKAAVLGCRK
ncbi:YdcF family protein [Gordonia sp. NPDC003425]